MKVLRSAIPSSFILHPSSFPVAEPLVLVTRGSFVESVHRGHLVASDGLGRRVAVLGSPEAVAFIRSAAKPFQAVPLVASGAAEAFGLEDRELAVACGSHDATPAHTETVESLLRKAGLDVSDLNCGPHEPYSKAAAESLKARGERPTAVHNNCSGNHAGMLALARHLGADVKTYHLPENPAQREIFRAVSRFSGVPAEELGYAVDNCAAPTFALTIGTVALMLARLVSPKPPASADAARRIVGAMMAHPSMVEGEGELDTELMRAAPGRLVSKVGAEGVYAAGILPCERWPEGLGLACKIEDGDKGDRARPRIAVEALRQLGVLGKDELKSLSKFARETLKNHRGESVGEVRAAFQIPLRGD
ncbi:MAG: asparaginase [Acidobacteria bacterium]|nr:asparaginase [Acidobacteriota bacterium]